MPNYVGRSFYFACATLLTACAVGLPTEPADAPLAAKSPQPSRSANSRIEQVGSRHATTCGGHSIQVIGGPARARPDGGKIILW